MKWYNVDGSGNKTFIGEMSYKEATEKFRQEDDRLLKLRIDFFSNELTFENEGDFTEYVCSKIKDDNIKFIRTNKSWQVRDRRHPPAKPNIYTNMFYDLYYKGVIYEIKHNISTTSLQRAVGQCIFYKQQYKEPVGIILPKVFNEPLSKDTNPLLNSDRDRIKVLKKICKDYDIKLWFI